MRPGGRIVLVDSDWTTLAINSDQSAIARQVVNACTKRVPNPGAGRSLRQLTAAAGATDLHEASWTLPIGPEGATAALLTQVAQMTLSRDELRRWQASLDRMRDAQQPYGSLTVTMVAGTKPV